MNNRWKIWLYPVGCLAVAAILLIFVLTASGCSASSSTGNSDSTAYASESTTTDTSEQILVCSHLGLDQIGQTVDFNLYASAIWVEPVSQNVFVVHYIQRDGNAFYYRTISGPLIESGGYPITFNTYQYRAEKRGYTFVYES